ncbi:MAG: transposase zinc-binding domain-containing protein, partial [Proteobacteria bacterium]|nr:transposase zinc-binding domain-containing protein [Pseudomonadota bacterium]
MGAINDIFTTFGPDYLDRYGDRMPDNHKKAIRDIVSCRTETQGLAVYQCLECNTLHMVYKSCGNRHCPSCQYHKSRQWLEKQKQRQLPSHHFMITFTVPQEIRDFIRGNQRVCYSAMFKASSDSIKKLAKDPKFIGGDLVGFFGVLHTWGRLQQYHPHIHYIAPGGAVSDGKWLASRVDFFLPVHALSKIFRAK